MVHFHPTQLPMRKLPIYTNSLWMCEDNKGCAARNNHPKANETVNID